jgi:hypothetical protein
MKVYREPLLAWQKAAGIADLAGEDAAPAPVRGRGGACAVWRDPMKHWRDRRSEPSRGA